MRSSAVIALNVLLIAISSITHIRLATATAEITSSRQNSSNLCHNSDNQDPKTCIDDEDEDEEKSKDQESENVASSDEENEDEHIENEEYFYEEEEEELDPCESYEDHDENCAGWAELGECDANTRYMFQYCHKSCCMETGIVMGVKQTIEGTDDVKESTIQNILEAYAYVRDEVMTTPDYVHTHHLCQNKHELCAFWAASSDECEENPNFMFFNCSFSCQSCEYVDMSYRCLLDDPEIGEDVFKPGEMNQMFESIISEEEFARYQPVVHSRPSADPEVDVEKERPWVITFDSFLTEEECDTLIKLGSDQGYERSEDVGERYADGTYGSVVSEERTSTNSWCWHECYDHPVTRRVMERMVNVTGVPEKNMERLQMLHYEVGQFYGEHHDFIEHHTERQSGPRILTFFLYLNDVEEGGGTRFPQLDLTVHPKKGKALLWPSVLDSNLNEIDERTDHEALPVLKGEKYGANAWLHLRDFENTNDNRCID